MNATQRLNISRRWKKLAAFFQSLEIFLLLLAAPVNADLLNTNDLAHVRFALGYMNMTEADLGFAKDHGEPRMALQWIRQVLKEPLRLADEGDRLMAAARSEGSDDLWRAAQQMLEVDPVEQAVEEAGGMDEWAGLDPELAQGLARFMTEARRADRLLDRAFEKLTQEEMSYLAASWLGGVFNAEDRAGVRSALVAIGVAQADVETTIRESLELDPKPSSMKVLDIIEKIDRSALIAAGAVFQRAAANIHAVARRITTWPDGNVLVVTDLGKVRVAGRSDETFTDRALLILSAGGHNTYSGAAGVASVFSGQRLAAIVDVAGNDTYRSHQMLGPGAALFGVSVIVDGAGDDVYRAKYTGQAAGIFGAAWLEDLGGDDQYEAHAMAQGAAVMGAGVLRDRAGNDVYSVGVNGQGFSGLYGFGLLLDEKGNDRYLAGGREPDHERNPDHFISLAQGMSIGMRPYAGGGVAALIDLEGNDSYVADVYGQGVGYYYSAGLLLDCDGNDIYSVYQYGQGTGIHLSAGLLADLSGNDMYSGYILAQGSAHDYSAGILLDHAGNDTYTADHHGQARGLYNAMALLLDRSGDDAYFARQPDEAQGIGQSGGPRDYGSLALLLDLDGSDQFSCGATNGARLLRPLYGIVYDADEGHPAEKRK